MITLTVKVQVNQFARKLSPKATESVSQKSLVSVTVGRGSIALPQIHAKLSGNLTVIWSLLTISVLAIFFQSSVESILTVPLFLAEISAKRMQKEQRPASHQLNVKLLVAARSFAQRTTCALSQVQILLEETRCICIFAYLRHMMKKGSYLMFKG